MKRFFYALVTVAMVAFTATNSYSQIFNEGSSFVQGGIGIGSAYTLSGSNLGIPPVHVSYELGIKEKIGVGGLIGFTTANTPTGFGGGEYRFSYIVIGARGLYHAYNEGKIDAYGGLMVGYNIASAKYVGPGEFPYNGSAGGFTIGAFVGGRYAFNDKFYGMAEIGYSIAWLSVGIGTTL